MRAVFVWILSKIIRLCCFIEFLSLFVGVDVLGDPQKQSNFRNQKAKDTSSAAKNKENLRTIRVAEDVDPYKILRKLPCHQKNSYFFTMTNSYYDGCIE